ncbi:IS4 family transposase [Longimicrobium terrae]|nr:IS4 family transposase [Longimicrobium terrae]NNC29106.1 IS4 family transposase [Longimicrobium terrae]NNC29372.1 IS4 family transposase [Longimicrobium terrae]
MNQGSTLFAQLLAHGSRGALDRCIQRYRGNHRVRTFTCRDQFLVMAFAQLTYRESLRDIEACLGVIPDRLYHMGIRGSVTRSTLADANERRDWRIYADYAQVLMAEARRLYAGEALALDLDQTVYCLDSSTIELCLGLFPWARFQKDAAGVKLHTLLDLRGSIPAYVRITGGSFSDKHVLDELAPEPGSIYVFDRGYLDFKSLLRLEHAKAIFVTRARHNLRTRRLYSHAVDRTTGLVYDQTIRLTVQATAAKYPINLRRVKFRDPETGKVYVFLTNDFELPALTIARLYKARWKIELFFKWIKQHLRIKAFYGRSPNAVQTQIWIAISVYLLVAIARKRLDSKLELYTLLQILSVTLFEKTSLEQAFSAPDYTIPVRPAPNQLQLFDL